VWFITFYGAMGFIIPYFNLLLQHYGYKGWQLGVISALRPFVSATCGPIWAALADKHSCHRRIFLTALAVASLVRVS
jgi:nitrate/nitrite transporter NarK